MRLARNFRCAVEQGRDLWLLGINAQAHDTGACLVRVNRSAGAQVVVNFEEDRLRFEKEQQGFPELSILEIKEQLRSRGIQPDDLFAVILPFDMTALMGVAGGGVLSESLAIDFLRRNNDLTRDTRLSLKEFLLPGRVQRELGASRRIPVISVRHHDSHAWHSYAASPFASSDEPTLIVVMDAIGDSASLSLYGAVGSEISLIYENGSLWDSLGFYYAAMTSALGGWPMGHGEGRMMGAAAFGNTCRETNSIYLELRRIFSFGRERDGLLLNRQLAAWPRGGFNAPFSPELERLLGSPVVPHDHWNPEQALDFEPGFVTSDTQLRLDRIAAVQMVFEDAVEEVARDGLKRFDAQNIVLTGGAALNCVAIQRLAARLANRQIWVPSTPGDAGVQMGGAFTFAVQNGAPMTNPMPTPYCSGGGPCFNDVQHFSMGARDLITSTLGSIRNEDGRTALAKLLAELVGEGCLVALVQGPGELGLRALGNRSILADARSRETRERLNRGIKRREPFRPLAPMVTIGAARSLFHLPFSLSAQNYDALSHMGVTVRARKGTEEIVPAAIHEDGTARLQIVREDTNPLAHAFLKAMGREYGVEAAINTSLNIRSPIVANVEQAIDTLRKAPQLDVLVVVDEFGSAWAIRHARSRQKHLEASAEAILSRRIASREASSGRSAHRADLKRADG